MNIPDAPIDPFLRRRAVQRPEKVNLGKNRRARRNDRPSDAKWFKALILLSAMLAAQHVSIATATKHTREKVAISQLLGYFSEDDSLFTNVIACMLDVDVTRFCTGYLGNHRRMLFYPLDIFLLRDGQFRDEKWIGAMKRTFGGSR